MEQIYLEELSDKLFFSNEKLGETLSDIIDELVQELKETNATTQYNKQDLKRYIIDRAIKEQHRTVHYGWNSTNVLNLLDLIEEFGGD